MAEKKKDLVELDDGSMVDPVTGEVEVSEEEEAQYLDESGAVESGVIVYREKLKPRNKGDKAVYTYKVRGMIRGVEVDATIVPADRGGYRVLPLVFGEATALPLLMVPYEMRDEKTGKKTSGYTYKVASADADGITLELKVKANRDSDKRILECLIAIANKGPVNE